MIRTTNLYPTASDGTVPPVGFGVDAYERGHAQSSMRALLAASVDVAPADVPRDDVLAAMDGWLDASESGGGE